ncbi:beta-phosphoglucomutase family hydrolase [Cnuibacter physcomitrellae]|uniref:HAD family hydrolase n=1 Tax=Cnuibacter physcomitrellae TaxID=1619308 RepID=UPI002175D6A0|nr:beta-phosphoglucomutase family hydrolase [Cnuibacter physcomitrellae]MCS5497166.1 beta-phosphoglucomutase family hydrolase [Cnuibacter physcomitrellae]
MPAPNLNDALQGSRLKAFLFDLDGVLTPTVDLHKEAWRLLFEDEFAKHGVAPYEGEADYVAHVDGKPRFDGVRDMLAARGITLPEGELTDPPTADTVMGLGNRKNEMFERALAEQGIAAYPGSLALLDALRGTHFEAAVVSSSRNAVPVLEVARIRDRFDVIVDGVVAAAEGLPGKPAPDTYRAAAARLGLEPSECVVVEDALSGVQAGRAGDFGLVIGVDRGAGGDELIAAGADVVVDDLSELVPATEGAA